MTKCTENVIDVWTVCIKGIQWHARELIPGKTLSYVWFLIIDSYIILLEKGHCNVWFLSIRISHHL